MVRVAKTLAIALLIAVSVAHGESNGRQHLNGKVVRVADGDSLFVDPGRGKWVEVRLFGIDCPETEWPDRWPAQPMSEKAKEFARNRVLGKKVTVVLTGETTHGRAVGEVLVDGRSLNRELVRAGLAWWNKRYAPLDRELKRLQAAARRSKRGIWSIPNPVPPWVHRRRDR